MRFTENYPSEPPKIIICTPIRHPNIFGEFLCLSMLRPESLHSPYEGWSSTYSKSTFNNAKNQQIHNIEQIEQDSYSREGRYEQARLNNNDVEESLRVCRAFVCKDCGHTNEKPIPKVYELPTSDISLHPIKGANDVLIHGTAAQTTSTYWVSCKASLGVFSGKVLYEVYISWSGDKWTPTNTNGGLCRFGWGTKEALELGTDDKSVGYGGTAKLSYRNKFLDYGEEFGKGDCITCAVDFDQNQLLFAKNGHLVLPVQLIPPGLKGHGLYPMVSLKNSRAEFNFGNPRKPVPQLTGILFN
ncbi:DEAD box ATP-dependent RNA helicase [Reticulomyxa filosa]|uniref:DEAD box ATP-dependent RNA helicase n=1 Tax=Reticulomyxa filosa TaxID=46433 RepID=X6MSA8_RETFI|nr:DEAD box ATP-dependent RNA helicase [Reticulomyxa filosa]|eukprot:ETO16332.1 DEAD box ATP-dependent RNA helicase [Reticulomyxa filosa]